jgi:hypothetical protein
MKKSKNEIKNFDVFNSPLDIGLRALFLLVETKKTFDLQSLVYLDYFLIHSGDMIDGPESLHPASTFHAGEILVKRDLMKEGLRMMHLKQLLDIVSREDGIHYSKNKLTSAFIKNHFKTNYSKDLSTRAKWLNKKFGRYDEKKLKQYVDKNISKWGVEFLDKTSRK